MKARSLSAGRITDTACTPSTVRRGAVLAEDEVVQRIRAGRAGEGPALGRGQQQVEGGRRQVLELDDQPLLGTVVDAAAQMEATAGVDEDDAPRWARERLDLVVGDEGQNLFILEAEVRP